MNRPLPTIDPFPNHKFDFGDAVYVRTLTQGGIVEGIWKHDQGWHYRVSGLPQFSTSWWNETELNFACPQCLNEWDQKLDCPKCGFPVDDLT